jgi:NAD(P)-dependent dehydrogenase (short-subunit alcohol dehydrogenase family)
MESDDAKTAVVAGATGLIGRALVSHLASLGDRKILELARCEWIGRRENVLALGNSGTGKPLLRP